MKKLKKSIAAVAAVVMIISAVSAIGTAALTFDNYGDYKLVLSDNDTYLVYSYSGTDKNISLPIQVKNKPVIGVYGNCFENSDIESVVIPDNYITIGDSAFSDCHNLKSIVIPPIIERIGEFAFYNCTSLESVDMSRATDIKTISYGAFSGCKALSEVVYPPNLTSIREYAFCNTAIESVELPQTVENLSEGCFSECRNLNDVDLPNTLKTIGKIAFYNSRCITEIYVPKSVTSIGEEVFEPMLYNDSISIGFVEGSVADEYCQKNSAQTVVSVKFGDANSDGLFDVRDATYIQRVVAGLKSFDSDAVADAADVNGDGEISVRDATLIQMRIADIITHF